MSLLTSLYHLCREGKSNRNTILNMLFECAPIGQYSGCISASGCSISSEANASSARLHRIAPVFKALFELVRVQPFFDIDWWQGDNKTTAASIENPPLGHAVLFDNQGGQAI